MRTPSRLLRFLAFPALGFGRSADRQISRIRAAMLGLLQVHGGHLAQRIAQRVRFAGDLETLWYLRQDVLTALSEIDGELSARHQMRGIDRMFKGGLPTALGPRSHHPHTT